MTKSLYLHIPFCNKICSFCDFNRFVTNNKVKDDYVKKLIELVKKQSINNQYNTIYIGGGTPNCLDNKTLSYLLASLVPFLDKDYEFTIELNPELVNQEQVEILDKNGINRVSLGVQTLNDELLKSIGSSHSKAKVINAIKLLHGVNIKNISCDFIYGFNNQTTNDIKVVFDFLKEYQIPHFSFYELEVDNNSIFNKLKYQKDNDKIQDFGKLIDQISAKLNYIHYEVSNYSIDKNHYAKHNINYWNLEPWKAIGYGAYGFENMVYYHYKNRSFKKVEELWDKETNYQTIIQMGLRMKDGLDLTKNHHLAAFNYYKNLIKDDVIVQNNHVFCKNINNLNQILLKLIK